MIKRLLKIIFLISIFLIGNTFAIIFTKEINEKIPVSLKQEEFIFEYGDEISYEISNYFNILHEESLEKVVLDIKPIKEVGEYKQFLTWKEQSIPFKIIVQDTNPPLINLKNEKVEINVGNTFEVKSYVESCKDLVDGELAFKTEGEVNTNKAGEYKIKIIATDKNKNTSSKDLMVVVKENKKNEVINENKTNSNTNIISNKKQHKVYDSKIIQTVLDYNQEYDWNPNLKIYRDMILNSSDGKIYFVDSGSFATVDISFLTEEYLSYQYEDLFIYDNKGVVTYTDSNGSYIQIIPERLDDIKQAIRQKEYEFSEHRVIYKNTISKALNSMNLYCSDVEMVNQINNWIVKKLSYQVTNNNDYWEIFSVNNSKGQCYHYSMLFRDMCKAVGINAAYEKGTARGNSHAWNTVTIDGKKYCFDVTWNDSKANNDWTWVKPEEFYQTHKK